jgi:hypothetical protein
MHAQSNSKEKSMNWDAIGAVAEILGSLTVIGTIFYLAIQVGHAAAVAKATTQQSTAQMSIDVMALTLDSQILSSASRKATAGEELNFEELSNYKRWVWVRERVSITYPQSFVDEVERILKWAQMHGDSSVTPAHSEYIAMLEKSSDG